MSGFSWSAFVAPARRLAGDPRRLPYLCAFIALVFIFSINQAFWLTNDDVAMSLISSGGGIASSPSPRLVLTNIVWGYLIRGFPDLGGIRSYTWVTYLALLLSWLGLVWGFLRSEVDHRLAAVLLVLAYAPVIVYPQYTLLAGYLAAAGLLLACNAIATRSLSVAWVAGLFIVVSGLVRADETVLVLLVAAPLCISPLRAAWASDLRGRWLAIAGVTAAVFIAFQALDYFSFASGEWSAYAQDYALRTGFTDFKFSVYFRTHPALLKGSGFSVNDMRLISDWFYLDTQVFSPQKLETLLASLPWEGRLHASAESAWELLEPFSDTFVAMLAGLVVLVTAFHRRPGHAIAALALFILVMVLLWGAGRPAITRIYIPVIVTLALLGITQFRTGWRRSQEILLVGALVSTLVFCSHLSSLNRNQRFKAQQVQASTCILPRDSLMVIWAGDYPLASEFTPFRPIDAGCPFDYYSFGEFSLAPYALEHLHQHTGGKDFVPAVLSGQAYDFIAYPDQLRELQAYFRQHYSTRLVVTPGASNQFFSVYRVAAERPVELRAPRP